MAPGYFFICRELQCAPEADVDGAEFSCVGGGVRQWAAALMVQRGRRDAGTGHQWLVRLQTRDKTSFTRKKNLYQSFIHAPLVPRGAPDDPMGPCSHPKGPRFPGPGSPREPLVAWGRPGRMGPLAAWSPGDRRVTWEPLREQVAPSWARSWAGYAPAGGTVPPPHVPPPMLSPVHICVCKYSVCYQCRCNTLEKGFLQVGYLVSL